MKLLDIKSKSTLYKYLAHQGRGNCMICKKMFWDKEQPIDEAYRDKHIMK